MSKRRIVPGGGLVKIIGTMQTIAAVNEMDRGAFVAQFGGVFEHSPWVAECAWERRPFYDRDALHAVMAACVREAEPARQMALIRAHPDLVGRAAREGRLGAASTAEQAGAGLDRLDPAQVAWFESRNRAYQERFGFPFIICVRANRRQAIIDGFETRLLHSPEQEKAAALAEIEKIAAFRLADMVSQHLRPER